MNTYQLNDSVVELGKALSVVKMMNKDLELIDILLKSGLTSKELNEVVAFIGKNFDEAEIDRKILQDAYSTYLNSTIKILKHVNMAKGYEEMGEINLHIAKEDKHLEDEVSEGAKVNEVDSKKTEDNTEKE